ncbi:hypothetical protein ICN28_09165 [Polynucleobacter sp. 30F-ANTBAC]|uniref:DUF6088 family protein n=1 Tax=Polynucleobacter sp. 30F-ANTBAC TaxID=2689095 RepID=UPI001CAA857D|nr:DUF6088 family protein [Polynucleobacter sp. 30F-ANTBAC]MBU3600687.1 hypothetical protein [Polynucleobacter sp. 30F-ANTBAC]
MQNRSVKVSSSLEATVREGALEKLRSQIKRGCVYRREDLLGETNAIDRHLKQLVNAGVLEKLAQGLYYSPKTSTFGKLPPKDEDLVAAFLKDRDFLLLSPNSYNSLGVGTTQLYNKTVVYNHKRHGLFKLGNRSFDFRVKPSYPKKLNKEFLFVDLLNNLESLAEDKNDVLTNAERQLGKFEIATLERTVKTYGAVRTKKRVSSWLSHAQLERV